MNLSHLDRDNYAFKVLCVRPENPTIVFWGSLPGLETQLSDENLLTMTTPQVLIDTGRYH
jgi:hypothetical protein